MKGAAPNVHPALGARETMALGAANASTSDMFIMDIVKISVCLTAMTIIAQV